MLGKVFGLYRAALVVAAGLLTGVGCSSGGAGSVPARSTEQVAAQRPQAVGNTLPAPTLASPAFPAVCNFATAAFGQVLKNGITCNLPEPGSTASIQVPLPVYLYTDPTQSDCSTAHLTAVVNQGTDTYGTSVSLSPDYLPGNPSCIGVGATTVTVTRGPEIFITAILELRIKCLRILMRILRYGTAGFSVKALSPDDGSFRSHYRFQW